MLVSVVRRLQCCALMGIAMIAVPTSLSFGVTPINIMPLGDSITAGAPSNYGGYRSQLVTKLTTDGIALNMVGTQVQSTSGASPALVPNYLNHEGHSGWRIDQLAANLNGYSAVDSTNAGGYWLPGNNGTGRAAINPDYVLVLAGINDIDSFYGNDTAASPMNNSANLQTMMTTLESRMTTLVSTLTTLRPNAKIMLSNLIPYANGFLDSTVTGATDANRATWAQQDGVSAAQEYGVNHYVLLLNAWIKNTFVPGLISQGKHVYFVNQYSNFIATDGSVGTGANGYADYGLHPNQPGYDAMGTTWANAIEAIVVPEPGTMAAIALFGWGLSRRRR